MQNSLCEEFNNHEIYGSRQNGSDGVGQAAGEGTGADEGVGLVGTANGVSR